MGGRRRWLAAGLALALVALPVRAEEAAPAGERPAAAAGEGVLRLLPEPVTTRHTIRTGEHTLDYTATAGTLPLRDERGEITALIFYTAYVQEPPSPARPVSFVFNGGPGAASAFLHLGGLGPRMLAFGDEGRYLPPPARLVDNPDGWLEFTDLVFVDPVGTGYSRPAGTGEEAERRYQGVRQDAAAMAAFIRLHLARAGRTLSPVFLVGESYGGLRAALLTESLPRQNGIAVSGAVLISPALELALLRGGALALLPEALALPSMAAVHLVRQGVRDPAERAARRAEVERFALGDYLVSLAAGPARLSPATVADLARMTGLAPATIQESYGRISVSRFIREYDRAQRRVLSRYDGTVDAPDPRPWSPEPRGPDPVLDRAVPVWTSAFVRYVRDELGYATDLTYRLLARDVSRQWDFGTRQGYAGALDELQAGRVLNPALEVLIAHGETDLATPYLTSRYLLDQLPPLDGAAPITFRVYPGGHMLYMRADSRRALRDDARLLYHRALAAAAPESPEAGE